MRDKLNDNRRKVLLAIVGGFALLWVIGATTGQDTTSAGGSTSSASASVVVLGANSLCLADPTTATIHYRITLRSYGTQTVTAGGTPWRRYSDNTVNDSVMDGLEMNVPAGETKTFTAEFGYDAEAHQLVECGFKLDGDSSTTKFAVVRY